MSNHDHDAPKWLSNVPDETRRLTFYVDSTLKAEFKALLEFIQTTQSRADLHKLAEDVYESSLRRRNVIIPPRSVRERLSMEIPVSLIDAVEERMDELGENQDEEISHQRYFEWALGLYLSRSSHPMIRAYKQARLAQLEAEAEDDVDDVEPESSESAASARAREETPSDGRVSTPASGSPGPLEGAHEVEYGARTTAQPSGAPSPRHD